MRRERQLPVAHWAGIVFVAWAFTGAIGVAAAHAPQPEPGHEYWTALYIAAQWAGMVLAWLLIAAVEQRYRCAAKQSSSQPRQ